MMFLLFVFSSLVVGSKCQLPAGAAEATGQTVSGVVCGVLEAECEDPSKSTLTRKSTFKQTLNPCTFGKSSTFNFNQLCN